MEQITEWLFKVPADSNSYLLLEPFPIVVDTGRASNKELVKKSIEKKIPCSEIKHVICTHLHYDHIGNLDLFPNATIHASAEEIDAYKTDSNGTVLDDSLLPLPDLRPLPEIPGFKVIRCPGHTIGSIALWNEKHKLLISGDTLFFGGLYGRTDLPTSVPDKMQATLDALAKLPVKILCPGHEY
jgi:hydroxyacylglutathione hydrolase